MKETFILRTEWFDSISELDVSDQAKFLQNLFHYHKEEFDLIKIDSLPLKIVWKIIEPNLKRNLESYDKRKESSSENGKLGGRPSEIIKDIKGNIVPSFLEGAHFTYLIYDTDRGIYKIGETSDLLKRRLSIKRPTAFLKIIAFAISDKQKCYTLELYILNRFLDKKVSGDWLALNDGDVDEIIEHLGKINLNKPKTTEDKTYYPIESLSVFDPVIVPAIESVIYSFDNFWDLYDKKVGEKGKLIKKWNALASSEKEKIMKYVPAYVLSTPDKKFRKDPTTFFNNKAWNNEIIGDPKPIELLAAPQHKQYITDPKMNSW